MSDVNNIKSALVENATSYASFADLLKSYKSAGGSNDVISSEFNKFDNPAHFYFRLFFDFGHGLIDASGDYGKVGLPDENKVMGKIISQNIAEDVKIHNSALNYLVLNNEWERADMLRQFIILLSNISMRSPWYFQEITGINEALERQEFTGEAFTIPNDKSIIIKCLPDAYDNRIGTLLDLYRSICYSYHLHKEIVPGNLRRFNMHLYIFNTDIRGIHSRTATYATYGQDSISKDITTGQLSSSISNYITSSKLIEFHDCEIDMNSNSTGFESVNNTDGFENIYAIRVRYAYATEQRYNEFLLRSIGDFILSDQDLPGAGHEVEEKPNMPIQIQKYDVAEKLNKLNASESLDNRILEFPRQNKTLNNEEQKNKDSYDTYIKKNRSDDNPDIVAIGDKKLFTNVYKRSTMDPWTRLIESKADYISDQFQRVVQAGNSAIDSWTNLRTLNENLVSSLKSLSYGNLFKINENNLATTLVSGLGSINSSNVLGKAGEVVRGWVHETI